MVTKVHHDDYIYQIAKDFKSFRHFQTIGFAMCWLESRYLATTIGMIWDMTMMN